MKALKLIAAMFGGLGVLYIAYYFIGTIALYAGVKADTASQVGVIAALVLAGLSFKAVCSKR